jgi:DNA (cytosine-5)-methyltransferase 1
LAPATERRIAEGVRRYVLGSRAPFLVHLTHGGRLHSSDEPLRTITTANRGEQALVSPTFARYYGEMPGRAPRTADPEEPLPTVTTENRFGLVAAFLARHYGGPHGHPGPGLPVDGPTGTVTGKDHHGLAAVFLDKLHGSAKAGRPIDEPAPTIATGGGHGGGHAALVAAFMLKYYGSGSQWSAADEPMHTVVSKARMGLVTVELDGEEYALVDIGMRMLQPRELARAQGFQDSYVLTGTKSEQVARLGNSVPPDVVAAVVRAQFPTEKARGAA